MSELETRQAPADPSAAHDPPTLEYQQHPPGSRAREWLVRIALSLVAVIAVEAGLYYLRDVSNWIALVRLRHEVMAFTLPKDSPVVTLLPSDSYKSWRVTYSSRVSHVRLPFDRASGFLFPRPSAGPGSQGTVFLHEVLASKARRVLAIHIRIAWHGGGIIPELDFRLFDPGTVMHPHFREMRVTKVIGPNELGGIPGFPGVCADLHTVPWGSNFQLFGGQIDPSDPSRFTIGYILNGKPGQLIGQLHDDDSVSLRDANGAVLPEHFPTPTTRPTP